MHEYRLTRRCLLGTALAPWIAPAASHAQAGFPERPLRLIVPFPAGNTADVYARPIAQKLTEALGQPVIVENKPGATGTLGVDAAAKAPPDGHTMVYAGLGAIVILPHLMKLPYDPLRDLAPITRVVSGPMMLVAHPGAPFNSVRELAAYSRARPGEVKVAGFGVGSIGHLTTLMIAGATGADLTHVPYQGGPQQVADTIGGQVPLLLDYVSVIGPHLKAGKLKALASTGPRRNPALPEVLTFEELGYKGVQATSWGGVTAHAATPAPVLRRLSQELTKVIATPDFRELAARNGAEVVVDTPETFGAYIRDEYERWGKLIRDHNVRLT